MSVTMFSLYQAFMSRVNQGKFKTRDTNTLQIVPSTFSDTWASMSSTIASLMFIWAIICQYSPYEVRHIVDKLKRTLKEHLNPYVRISIHESMASGGGIDRMRRSEAYSLAEAYLASVASREARRLRAELGTKGSDLILSMDDYQSVSDEFRGAKLRWEMKRVQAERSERGSRYYVLTFHRRHREIVTKSYLQHVMREGKEARSTVRQRKLYTNASDRICGSSWSHVVFEHPATFETMAMEPEKKREIFEDLVAFSTNREFYERAGKAWKRGYLLYGPPGTGKSTMVAAMANLLNYDVYDLELTAVKDNSDLRRLLSETKSKSVIVIEDIDCSLDLTGQRKSQSKRDEREKKKEVKNEAKEEGSSRVTLSGLLNFIDGIWSACGSERLIVFTTNYVDKLDPALIRSGRMDKHIELSYCGFEGFKVLAKNYLKLESGHEMFGEIEKLIGEVEITPADVAECLVPKSPSDGPERCLSNLVRVLEEAKESKGKE